MAGISKGVWGRKKMMAARALASGTVWDGRRLGRQRKSFVCGSPGVWDGKSVGDGKPLVLVISGQHGQQRLGWKRSGSGEGVGVGWQQRRRQLGRRLWGRQRLSASARESTLGKAAGSPWCLPTLVFLRCPLLGLDLQTLVGAPSSCGYLIHGPPRLMVLML